MTAEFIGVAYLSATVETWGVLGCEKHESRMSLDNFLSLSYKQLPVVIQQPVQSLQDVGGGKVQLIQDHPVPFPHGINQNTWTGFRHHIKLIQTILIDCITMSWIAKCCCQGFSKRSSVEIYSKFSKQLKTILILFHFLVHKLQTVDRRMFSPFLL